MGRFEREEEVRLFLCTLVVAAYLRFEILVFYYYLLFLRILLEHGYDMGARAYVNDENSEEEAYDK